MKRLIDGTKKRAKPFAASNASRKQLEADGWTVCVVEQRIPHCFITKDAFGFGDLLAIAPTRGIMLVQATGGASTSNFHQRVAKIKAEPNAGIWLASGGRIQVHSWEGKGQKRTCRVFEVQRVVEKLPSWEVIYPLPSPGAQIEIREGE